MHDGNLSQRLHFLERDFLTALESGATTVLASYHQTFSTLPDILRTASQAGSVGHETLALAHFVAARIAYVSSCFLDVNLKEESSTVSLQRDCDTMFLQMAALDLNATHIQPSQLDYAESPSSFLTPACRWLLDNLHNPYPTAQVKTQIATTSSCHVSSITSWFTNARRRIGWTTLCRERFSNCRADMIDAAHRALVEEDPQRTLSPELRHAFVAIKVSAESLYCSTFMRSTFAQDPDIVGKGTTEEDRESELGEYCQAKSANSTKATRDSYPSPDRSITASPTPALENPTDESEEDVDIVPSILAGSKRCHSSVESDDQPSSSVKRPRKRLRTSIPSPTYLPSPPSSTDGLEISSEDVSRELSLVHTTQPEADQALPSCKRRSSDTTPTSITKYPQNLRTTSPQHAASDSLLLSNKENEHSLDEWFNADFDALFTIPPPVDFTELDFTAPWEVELFKDYSIPVNPDCTLIDSFPAPSDSELGNLLQSMVRDTFAGPTESSPISNTIGPSYTVSLDPSMPGCSQTSLDWTSILNGPGAYQPTICSAFPQSQADSPPLPEIDLSMLQLPHVAPAVTGDLVSKQAKLDQLHALQEAVRRMERELQSEGIIV